MWNMYVKQDIGPVGRVQKSGQATTHGRPTNSSVRWCTVAAFFRRQPGCRYHRDTWSEYPCPCFHRTHSHGQFSPLQAMGPRVYHRLGQTARAQKLASNAFGRHTQNSPYRFDAVPTLPCSCTVDSGYRGFRLTVDPSPPRSLPRLPRNHGFLHVPQAVDHPVPSVMSATLPRFCGGLNLLSRSPSIRRHRYAT